MLCSIIGYALMIIVMAMILAVLLQVASKIVLKEAIEFGDAFKTAIVASIVSVFVDIGLQRAFPAEDQYLILLAISIGTTYLIWVLALSIIIDLTLGESLLVGAVFTIIKVLIGFALLAILAALVAGAAT